jgi:outer membrane protein assembly factor BamA
MPAILFLIFYRILQFNILKPVMAKVEVYHYKNYLLVLAMLAGFSFVSRGQYTLQVNPVDRDSIFIRDSLRLQTSFRNKELCSQYINKLPSLLLGKGYSAASIDEVSLDTAAAAISLYVGDAFHWAYLRTDSVEKKILDAVSWNKKNFDRKPVNLAELEAAQQKILAYMENNGYPFASVEVHNVEMKDQLLYADLVINKGPLYKIDSIRNQGTARISSGFLQHYLSIKNGSTYKKQRLLDVSKKLSELPYLQEKQPWSLTMLGTGSILNLHLIPKKSSQVNVLVGFLPSNSQTVNNKLLVTGEATVNLKNSLGGGETIGLNWQQIQVKSPRLNLAFTQPYLFNTPFGVDFSFDLFKKDSSFVNIGIMAGLQYSVSSNQTGTVFIQNLRTNLITVDTMTIKLTRRLPEQADLSSVNIGFNYQVSATDYRFNPRSGNEFEISASAGTKTIKPNEVISKLYDSGDPGFKFGSLYDTFQLKSYQFRVKLSAAHYFRLTRTSTIKAAVNGGWFQSPDIFRNELFQIGGYKLLRGFDEESIFASQYAVGTTEYRYLLGTNSYFFLFADVGFTKNTSLSRAISNTFIGAGLGMAFETKAGIFNISYAAGKRDDSKLNLRQSKIHIGYVNYF